MSNEAFDPGQTLRRLYPEADAGGYTRHDGFVDFYTRVNSLLTAESRVLDFGAGRGAWSDPGALPAVSYWLRSIDERVAHVAGVDIDPAVATNPRLKEAHVIPADGRLPFDDSSFDLVLADYVLEHVRPSESEHVAEEILRVLKPGGWFAARTPNRWGIIGIGARSVPNKWHTRVLKHLQPDRQDRDVFPVAYAMNTRRRLRKLFPDPHTVRVYGHTSEPRYAGNSTAAWRVARALDRLTPSRMEPTLMVFVRKAG